MLENTPLPHSSCEMEGCGYTLGFSSQRTQKVLDYWRR